MIKDYHEGNADDNEEEQNGRSQQHKEVTLDKGKEKILQNPYYENISGNSTFINDNAP